MSKVTMCSECKRADGDRCTYFDDDSDRESTIACILFEAKKPTVFHRITASPEVLAPYCIVDYYSGLDVHICYSTVTKKWYKKHEEAFASTPGIESEVWRDILQEDIQKICAVLKKARGEE